MVVRLQDLPFRIRKQLRDPTMARSPGHQATLTPTQRGRGSPTPHDLLWEAVTVRWPRACREHLLVDGRRFRGDQTRRASLWIHPWGERRMGISL